MGKFFFKYRGQIPVFVLVLAFPILYFSNHIQNLVLDFNVNIISLVLVLFGCIFRYLTIPNFFIYKKSSIKFNYKSLLRREYSGLLAILICIAYIDTLQIYISSSYLEISNNLLYLIITMITISLILKYLRKNTTILDD